MQNKSLGAILGLKQSDKKVSFDIPEKRGHFSCGKPGQEPDTQTIQFSCSSFVLCILFLSLCCLCLALHCLQEPCLILVLHWATAGWSKKGLSFGWNFREKQSWMFGPKFSPCKQLTLCPSGLRGWTQVPLAQTAWVQIPQVSYGSTPALPPPQKTKCGCSRHALAHRNS